MERMSGIPIGSRRRAHLCPASNLKRLGARPAWRSSSRRCFRDGYFHADMHPGNIFVAHRPGENHGKYIALDFGIMGHAPRRRTRATWRRISSPSFPPPTTTRVGDGAPRVRGGCRRTRASTSSKRRYASCSSRSSTGPLKEDLARQGARFAVPLRRAASNVQVQPQLTLLQKTLLAVEGLGRQLDPDLDLWVTAKPFPRTLDARPDRAAGVCKRRLLAEAPYIVAALA